MRELWPPSPTDRQTDWLILTVLSTAVKSISKGLPFLKTKAYTLVSLSFLQLKNPIISGGPTSNSGIGSALLRFLLEEPGPSVVPWGLF